MNVLDYSRSFVTFVTAGRANNARIQIESRCSLVDAQGKDTRDYYLFASCKAERTYAQQHLFQDPNYDFCGIFSEDEYAIFRSYAEWSERYVERGLWRDKFKDLVWHLRDAPEAKMLDTNEEITAATLSGEPLVGRTELTNEAGTIPAVLEYPIKTMNVNDIRHAFQVDTGPIPFPDLEAEVELPVERFHLAFIAFNASDFAEFVQEGKTRLGCDPQLCVPHYSLIRRVKARNRVIAVGQGAF